VHTGGNPGAYTLIKQGFCSTIARWRVFEEVWGVVSLDFGVCCLGFATPVGRGRRGCAGGHAKMYRAISLRVLLPDTSSKVEL
tara:strand:- start:239685 stop:239933 length:249 start_codon:yes stop_codon:yes gene_type:complete